MQVERGNDKFEVAPGHEWFWNQFADGSWEPDTFRVFDRFLKPGDTMLDIGAWIGPTALYAAKRVKQVYAFEPDPVALGSLIQNLRLNDIKNVVAFPAAVSSEWGKMPFGAKTGFGDSMSSVLWAKGGMEVPTIAFESLVLDLNPAFIKIDIEGGEKDIFRMKSPVLEQMKPTIYLSLHTPWFNDERLESFKKFVELGIGRYPYFYDEKLNRIALKDAFDPHRFNAIVATYHPLI